MVSFSCENCGDVLTKKKLDGHRNQCYGASFTCLDCMVHFPGTSYKSHTACITEDQKYQGRLFKEKKPRGPPQRNSQQQCAPPLTPRNTYVEEAPEADNAVALVDAPPRAPTPPPAAHSLGYKERAALPSLDVFDFLDAAGTPARPMHESRMIQDSQPVHVMDFQLPDDNHFTGEGFAYGDGSVRPSNERYESYATPAPKSKKSKTRDKDVETTSKKSDRKRKRNSPCELDLSLAHAQQERDVSMADAPAEMHTGLTGGLSKLLARPEFPPSPDDSADYANSPLSPMKRAKQGTSKAPMRAQQEWEAQPHKDRKTDLKEERVREKKDKDRGRERDRKEQKASTALVKIRHKKQRADSTTEVRRQRRRQSSSSVSPAPQDGKALKAIEYHRPTSAPPAPESNGQMIVRPSGELAPIADPRVELFMGFVNKGPDSGRGVSVHKALKRYHRERRDSEPTKADEEKELWKNMRLKKNDRGEIVLFFAAEEKA